MARNNKIQEEEVQKVPRELDIEDDFNIDDSAEVPNVQLKEVEKVERINTRVPESSYSNQQYTTPINPLRNERIIVRFLGRKNGIWGDNPKHVLAGGMSENAVRKFVVPLLSTGAYVNVLTNNEKEYLEQALGLEYNAMSIYKKENNFWSDANPNGINSVTLHKQDNYFDLSNPVDYIKYKILLANKNLIAPSLQVLEDKPKATYQYVIISENDETKMAKSNMSVTMRCYKEFGKIEDDRDKLRMIVETITGKPTAPNTKIDILQAEINKLIQKDGKMFLRIATDELLDTKVLIKKSIEAGLIVKRGDYLYVREDNSPLCEYGEEPTFNIAAKYLSNPKRQELKFSLEAKLK